MAKKTNSVGLKDSKAERSGFCDNPVDEDFLGCAEYYEGLSNFITKCPTPMTVAIQGDWGTGKSTAMKIVAKNIKDNVCILNFNTWKYAKTSGNMLMLPLIKELKKKLDECCKDDEQYNEKFMKKDNRFKKIFQSAAGIGLLTVKGLIENVSGAGNTIDDVLKRVVGDGNSEENTTFFEVSDMLHEEIQERINHVAKTKNKIVVFVDDLDRLEPSDAVSLLEDMKNIMDFENCVYILALDHNLVKKGLSRKYDDIEDLYAERFFDKIIQMPFYLPVNKYNIVRYIERLNDGCKLLSTEEVGTMAGILESFGDNNPRTIKRLLNIMLLYDNMDNKIFSDHKIECFAINLLQINHGPIFDMIKKAVKAIPSFSVEKVLTEKSYYQDKYNAYLDHLRMFWAKLKEDTDNDEFDLAVINRLEELVKGDCILLRDIMTATSVTGGIDLTESLKVTKETTKMINGYLKEQFSFVNVIDEKADRKTWTYTNELENTKLKISLTEYTAGDRDHVNVTITDEASDHDLGSIEEHKNKIVDELRKMGRDQINIPFYKNYKEADPKKFSFLSSQNNSFCLYRVSAENIESVYVTGKILRNIKEHGVPFLE
ncbi:MAG: KAP family NTPase [Lachnospiraceae bacterium]|nr:KAP family NTPase [Lachnospiraceae bacterium]